MTHLTFWICLFLALFAPLCEGYAKFMCNLSGFSYCGVSQKVGAPALPKMGSGTITLSTARSVTVTQTLNGVTTPMTTGSTFAVGDGAVYTVSLTSTVKEWVLEVSGAQFTAGYCPTKNRVYYDGKTTGIATTATLVMPTTVGTVVSIFGAWATGQVSVVATATFTMTSVAGAAPPPTPLPIALPTASPTLPLAPPPTPLPTASQTSAPSSPPTVSPTPLPTTAVPTPIPTTAIPTKPGQTLSPSTLPTAAPTPVPTLQPSPKPSSAPTFAPSAGPTPHPSLAPTAAAPAAAHPSPEPTAAPTFEATTASPNVASLPTYSAQIAVTLSGLASVSDWYAHLDAATNAVAQGLTIEATSVVFLPLSAAASGRRDLLSTLHRFLQGSASTYTTTLIIVGQTSQATAQATSQSAASYMTTKFATDFNNDASVSSTGLVLQTVTVQSATAGLASPIDSFQYKCDLNGQLSLLWNVKEDGSGVDAMMYMKSKTNWFSAGITALDEVNMVTTLSVPNKAYMYAPVGDTTPLVGYYALSAETADDCAVPETIKRNGGITRVQSISGYSTMSFTIPADTGVASDTQIDLVDHNTVIWAHGADWPHIHPKGAYGFTQVYWSSGNCKGVLPVQNPSPYYAFLLLFFAGLYNSHYSPLRYLSVVRNLNGKRLPVSFLGLDEYSLPGAVFVIAYLILICVYFSTRLTRGAELGLPDGSSHPGSSPWERAGERASAHETSHFLLDDIKERNLLLVSSCTHEHERRFTASAPHSLSSPLPPL